MWLKYKEKEVISILHGQERMNGHGIEPRLPAEDGGRLIRGLNSHQNNSQ